MRKQKKKMTYIACGRQVKRGFQLHLEGVSPNSLLFVNKVHFIKQISVLPFKATFGPRMEVRRLIYVTNFRNHTIFIVRVFI